MAKMKKEEAVKMMKARLKCLECDTNGTSENCEECYLNYEQGMLGEQIEWMKVAIKTMEQEPILDKIRAEILDEAISHSGTGEEVIQAYVDGLNRALKIIDKYKSESEGEK